MLVSMQETQVAATDFRAHLTDFANAVTQNGERVLMVRHRLPMVALVSKEDLEFLRQHKPLPGGRREVTSAPVEAAAAVEPLPAPETLETAELERLYAVAQKRTDAAALWWT